MRDLLIWIEENGGPEGAVFAENIHLPGYGLGQIVYHFKLLQ